MTVTGYLFNTLHRLDLNHANHRNMKLLYPITFLAITSLSVPAAAQQFVNGDLEANSPCGTQILNSQFNMFMYDAGYGFGTTDRAGYKGEIYLSATSGGGCVEGPAQKGSYFLGLASYTYGLVDAMSLKLDAPLLANKTYVLTFYTKKSRSVNPTIGSIPLEIGYTTDSLKFGTMVTTVQAPTTSAWLLNTVNIRPTVPTRYITVQAVRATTGGFFQSYTFVDNFKIAVGTDVKSAEQAFAIAPHPNPFQSKLQFSIAGTAKMPCAISVADMTGRVAMRSEVSDFAVSIPRGDLSAGVYMLSVKDATGAVSYSRIVAE